MNPTIPDRWAIILIDFDPRSGSEQSGKRPAVVLSRKAYNKHGLTVVCPITSKIKGYPFECILPEGLPIHGAVLSDQINTIDWRHRLCWFIGVLPHELLEQITNYASKLVQWK